MVTNYMMNKIVKAMLYQVVPCGTKEQKFKMFSKNRARCGIRRKIVVQKCMSKNDDTCVCSWLKPSTACAECGIPLEIYVLDYFQKESIACT
jgi:hypothetical protein